MINVCSCKNRKKNVNINNWLSKALISKYISLFVKYINGTIIYVQLEIQVEYYKCRLVSIKVIMINGTKFQFIKEYAWVGRLTR